MIGTFSTAGFTREAWIEKRVAEGFTKEQAEHEFDNYTDPAIAKAQEQKVPTRGEMIQMINEAILNNPNKKQLYIPDFSLSAEYIGLKNELDKAVEANNLELVQELNKRMLYVKISGTVTNEEIQAEIDKTFVMPLSEVFEEYNKYKAIVAECEEKIDNFDVPPVLQAKVDALTAEYKRKSRGKSGALFDNIEGEYNKAVDELELKYIKIPVNDLALKRYRSVEFMRCYEARIKYYMTANEELIKEEIQNAKREEIRGSLEDLVTYMEEHKDKEDDDNA